jgi:hypothetical protein
MAVKSPRGVEHACGHSQIQDLSAKRISERGRYTRWLDGKKRSDRWHVQCDRRTSRRRDEWLETRRAEEGAETEVWETRVQIPVLDGSERAVDWARRVCRGLVGAAYENLGLDEAPFTPRMEAPARLIRLARWVHQRNGESADLGELSYPASSCAVPATESPY